MGLSNFIRRWQYQAKTEPTAPPVPIGVYVVTVASHIIIAGGFIPQAHTEPVFVPAPLPQGFVSTNSAGVTFSKRFIYQSVAEPAFVPPAPSIDGWNYPWSEPVRVKPRLSDGLQQAQAQVLLRPEVVTFDKWNYPWSEPVRVKPRLLAYQQQAQAQVLIPPTPPPPQQTSIAQFVGANVQYEARVQYQSQARPVFTPTVETITLDKWFKPFDDPVREKIGLRASLQQALIAPVLADDQITGTIESRWHQAWSEPVRFRRFPTSEQQALIQGPPQTVELITVDKWIYAWSEPVRQKIGLKAHLQQAYIAPVLDNETQIIQDFESRWHQPWSEPVRVKRPLLTAQQQALIFQSAFFETINIDKWGFAWSEPVREKIGLKTHLQQAFIGITLNPETQIIQNYESRWHLAWSEPVRVRPQVPAGEQQALIQGPIQTPEFITVDKWIYPWTDPVRQKIGLKTNLQQALIAPVLADDQITGSIEARWHQPWSEPVRFRRLPTSEQQAAIQGPVKTPEFITVDKWIYAWSEPVREKIGLAVRLQQVLIAPVLADEQLTGTIEARWHQPWSEPVRFRRFPTAEQPSYTAPATSVFETITVDKWIYAWSEPVRQKIGIKANLQQAFIGLTLNPETQIIQGYESRWHQPWSEPVRPKASAANQPTSTWNTFTPARAIFEDDWHQAWSEPVRQKIGLRTNLQQTFVAPVIPRPIFVPTLSSPVIFQDAFQYPTTFAPPADPILTRTINWFAPLNEPVRLKIGLGAYLQRWFTADTKPIPNVFQVTLSATEVNTDSALFGIILSGIIPIVGEPTCVVSIKELPVRR